MNDLDTNPLFGTSDLMRRIANGTVLGLVQFATPGDDDLSSRGLSGRLEYELPSHKANKSSKVEFLPGALKTTPKDKYSYGTFDVVVGDVMPWHEFLPGGGTLFTHFNRLVDVIKSPGALKDAVDLVGLTIRHRAAALGRRIAPAIAGDVERFVALRKIWGEEEGEPTDDVLPQEAQPLDQGHPHRLPVLGQHSQ